MLNEKDERVRKIEAGELENVKASEEVTRRNVQMILNYNNETRKMLKELDVIQHSLQAKMIQQDANINAFRVQLAYLQQKVFASGTVEDGDKR